jgi:hypothetical protein
MRRWPFHGSTPALTSINPDTRRRAGISSDDEERSSLAHDEYQQGGSQSADAPAEQSSPPAFDASTTIAKGKVMLSFGAMSRFMSRVVAGGH